MATETDRGTPLVIEKDQTSNTFSLTYGGAAYTGAKSIAFGVGQNADGSQQGIIQAEFADGSTKTFEVNECVARFRVTEQGQGGASGVQASAQRPSNAGTAAGTQPASGGAAQPAGTTGAAGVGTTGQ